LPSSASSISFSMASSSSASSAIIKRNHVLRGGPCVFQMFFGCDNCALSQFKFHCMTSLYCLYFMAMAPLMNGWYNTYECSALALVMWLH
jgi:hypothetical protein